MHAMTDKQYMNRLLIWFKLKACEVDHGTLYLFNILLNLPVRVPVFIDCIIYILELNIFILKLRQNTL